MPVSKPSEARKGRSTGPPTGGPILLLVEDHELVRACTAEMLVDLGYRVVEADSAEEAIRHLRHGLRPDLMVTDHLMPGMNGVDLARLAHASFPSLPILVVSGSSELGAVPPDLSCLPKPFLKSQLADHLLQIGRSARPS